jgi:hypothetical protein
MPDINFSIKVIDSSGRPISNVKVAVFDNANIGGSYDSDYTDDDGWVTLSIPCFGYSFPGKVFIDGEEVGSQTFSDGDSASYYL